MKQQKMVEKMISSYTEKKETDFERLIKMDQRAKFPAQFTAYCVGAVGVLLFGIGLCFVEKVFGDAFVLGIVLTLLGVAIAGCAYPIYRMVWEKSRKKHAPEIIALSNKILNL